MTVIDIGHRPSQANEHPIGQHPLPEGVFVPQPPSCEFETQIKDVRPYRKPEEREEGTIWFDQFTMDNDFIYRVKTGVSSNLASDLAVDMTTPWWTGEEGHNSRPFLHFMSAGFLSRLYGPPLLAVPKGIKKFTHIPELFGKAFEIDMGNDVHNYALIANHLDEKYKNLIAPGLSMWYGESRAAMESIGAQARAALHGRLVLYIEAIDACMEHAPKPGEVSLGDGLAELTAAGRMVTHLLLERRRRYYGQTLDTSLGYMIPAIGTYRTITSGLAGQFGDELSLDARAHNTFFDHSIGNQVTSWLEKFKNHPGIVSEVLEGGHITLAEREIIFRSLARLVEVRNEYERHGPDVAKFDFEKVATAQTDRPNRIKTSTRFDALAA